MGAHLAVSAEFGHALQHLRVGQRAIDLGIDPGDRLARGRVQRDYTP